MNDCFDTRSERVGFVAELPFAKRISVVCATSAKKEEEHFSADGVSADSPLLIGFPCPEPLQLEFYLLLLRPAFMLDIDDGVGWNRDSFSRDLNPKGLVLFDAVGKATQFCNKLIFGIIFLNVALRFLFSLCHVVNSFWFMNT